MGVFERNRIVSSLRGERWRANLVRGRMESQFFPSMIKIIRVKRAIPQYDIAKAIGISIASFGGIERSMRPARPEIAEKIAGILGVPLTKLFTKKEKKLFAIVNKKDI